MTSLGMLCCAKLGGNVTAVFFGKIRDPAHPETKRPQRRHRGLAGDVGVFIQNIFGFAEKHKQIQLVIADHQRIDAVEVFAEITGYRCGGVHKHAITPAAHEEWDRLVHRFIFHPVGVIGPQDHLLAPFIQAGKRFAAAEYFFSRRQ